MNTSPEEYATEIAIAQRRRPSTRFIVYDHGITKIALTRNRRAAQISRL